MLGHPEFTFNFTQWVRMLLSFPSFSNTINHWSKWQNLWHQKKHLCKIFSIFSFVSRPNFSMELHQNGIRFQKMEKRFYVAHEFNHQWNLRHFADLHLFDLFIHGISQISQHENISRWKWTGFTRIPGETWVFHLLIFGM